MIKTCKMCGKQFETPYSAVYCSAVCRAKGKREINAKCDKKRNRARALRVYDVTCAECGERFQASGRGAWQVRYCSDRCRETVRKRNHNEYMRTAKGMAARDRANAKRKAAAKTSSAAPTKRKPTDVYTPDRAALERAAIINEYRAEARRRAGF